MAFAFAESEEFNALRRDLSALRAEIELSEASRGVLPADPTPEQIHMRDAQLFLLYLQNRNARVRALLAALSSQTEVPRRTCTVGPTREAPGLTIEFFDGFRCTLE
jgi:hypothetical protein